MRRKSVAALFLVIGLAVSGCGSQAKQDDREGGADVSTIAADEELVNGISDMFSNRDFEIGYDESGSARIELNKTTAVCSSDAVKILGSTVTITDEGTYVITGTLDDGMIIVDADKEDKTQLVFDNVSINSGTCAPVYVRQADKVFITLAQDSVNTLSNGGIFEPIDDNNIDAVIFSKEDLTLNGAGSLMIDSPAGHGIVSKDELTITSGTYEISSASHALDGKDSICIANAVFTITSGKDGIHAEHDDDTELGFAYIESGTFEIAAGGDGVSAGAYMCILDGNFDIMTGGGSENGEQHSSDFQDMGGGRGGFGGPGMGGKPQEESAEDGESMKGIKASGSLTISGGTFKVDSADDAVHSNEDLTIEGGTFEIASGDDGFHADESLSISSGVISVSESYEGLEGLSLDISGGEIVLTASDDGLNAAGGTDQSGFGGHRGGDRFGGMGGMMPSGSDSDSYIKITGGVIDITASGDGIDANGSLDISGGTVTVCGPTRGDTAVLDYDSTGTISGGTFVGTGSYMMAQTLSSTTEQGVVSVSVGSQKAGTEITLEDADGDAVITHTPELDYAIVILSSPDIVKGETYLITVGEASGEFTAQ